MADYPLIPGLRRPPKPPSDDQISRRSELASKSFKLAYGPNKPRFIPSAQTPYRPAPYRPRVNASKVERTLDFTCDEYLPSDKPPVETKQDQPNKVKALSKGGATKTLSTMTEEEILELERQYGVPVQRRK